MLLSEKEIVTFLQFFLKKGFDRDWALLHALKKALGPTEITLKPEMLKPQSFSGPSFLLECLHSEEIVSNLPLQPLLKLSSSLPEQVLQPEGEIKLLTLKQQPKEKVKDEIKKAKEEAVWQLIWRGERGEVKGKTSLPVYHNPFPHISSSYVAYLKEDCVFSPSACNPSLCNVLAIESTKSVWVWKEESFGVTKEAEQTAKLLELDENTLLFIAAATLLDRYEGIVQAKRTYASLTSLVNLDFYSREVQRVPLNLARAIASSVKHALLLTLRLMPNAGEMTLLQEEINRAGNIWRDVITYNDKLMLLGNAIQKRDGIFVKKKNKLIDIAKAQQALPGEDLICTGSEGNEQWSLWFTVPYGAPLTLQELEETIKKIKNKSYVINAYIAKLLWLKHGGKEVFLLNGPRHIWW